MLDFAPLRREIDILIVKAGAVNSPSFMRVIDKDLQGMLDLVNEMQELVKNQQQLMSETISNASPLMFQVLAILRERVAIPSTSAPKVEAIKLVRNTTGWSLKEAKDYVDRIATFL